MASPFHGKLLGPHGEGGCGTGLLTGRGFLLQGVILRFLTFLPTEIRVDGWFGQMRGKGVGRRSRRKEKWQGGEMGREGPSRGQVEHPHFSPPPSSPSTRHPMSEASALPLSYTPSPVDLLKPISFLGFHPNAIRQWVDLTVNIWAGRMSSLSFGSLTGRVPRLAIPRSLQGCPWSWQPRNLRETPGQR